MPTSARPRRILQSILKYSFMLSMATLGVVGIRHYSKAERPRISDLPLAIVRRIDLGSTVLAGGRVESRQQTTIECELENLEIRSGDKTFTKGGASTILSVLPEGTIVKKDDVICTLDSADYEEAARLQQIKVERSRAQKIAAELEVEVAEIAIEEFQQGTTIREIAEIKGQIALNEAEIIRAQQRLDYTKRMVVNGYVAKSQLQTELIALRKSETQLAQLNLELENYRRFFSPHTAKQLENKAQTAKIVLTNESASLERQEERLQLYGKMVEQCTIRAPHDGFLMYFNPKMFGDDRNTRIEEGAQVRQRQKLFILPDLDQMDAVAMLHESVVDRVHTGMVARIHLEGLPGRSIEGHVTAVSHLPLSNERSTDIKHYAGLIHLDSVPNGIRPGMTAEIEVVTDRRREVLAIPTEAIVVEGAHGICYVAHEEGVERREVTLGVANNRDLMEIISGLEEGEEVVLDPIHNEILPSLVMEYPPHVEPTTESHVAAVH